MTRIDFHFNASNKIRHACRLARKARAAGSEVVIYSADEALLSRLDAELWSFSALDFLPHCRASDTLAAHTPILLTNVCVDTPHHEVLVNLDSGQPEFFGRFERLIEVVGTDEQDRLAARERWKFYKDRGYALATFDLAAAA